MNSETLAAFCEGELEALLRRDWASRVLDAWAMAGQSRCVELFPGGEGWRYVIKRCVNPIKDTDEEFLDAHEMPDGARILAADALWSDLPEAVRREIGAKP